ncbi:hypothetical protein [Teredinibacter turnerae]|nr:hypothetical protein [Teredinibacter turnerae]
MKGLTIFAMIFLTGCIPPYTWNVIRETKIEKYDSNCIRSAVHKVSGVIGVVSTLPSQSYTLTGKPLPRYRQFLVETEYGIAYLNISDASGKIDVSASFSGYEEKPEGIETQGADALSGIVNSISRNCGNGI